MKLVVTTVYENVDKEWKNWWLKHNGPNYGMLNWKINPWNITSKDPTSDVVGTTTVQLIEEPPTEEKEE